MECAKIKVRYIQWMVWTELQSKYLRKKSENISSLNDTSYQTQKINVVVIFRTYHTSKIFFCTSIVILVSMN